MKLRSGPRRRPRRGGYERGHATREQIITAALRVFGEHGYNQASTRQIAAEAGVKPPALQYYFDSKEGLHRACAQFIIDRAALALSSALAFATEVIRARREAQALEAIDQLLDALTDTLSQAGSESWSQFIARGRSEGPTAAMNLLRRRLGMPVMDTTVRLVALATGTQPTDEVARLRMLMILGQARWIHASRPEALMVMGWKRLDEEKLALVKNVLREHTRAALRTGRSVERPRRSGARRGQPSR
jgi:TetR/AcrR family transcriptional regulator, regulator of cefoperazone and chloramphenicol sensitivity